MVLLTQAAFRIIDCTVILESSNKFPSRSEYRLSSPQRVPDSKKVHILANMPGALRSDVGVKVMSYSEFCTPNLALSYM